MSVMINVEDEIWYDFVSFSDDSQGQLMIAKLSIDKLNYRRRMIVDLLQTNDWVFRRNLLKTKRRLFLQLFKWLMKLNSLHILRINQNHSTLFLNNHQHISVDYFTSGYVNSRTVYWVSLLLISTRCTPNSWALTFPQVCSTCSALIRQNVNNSKQSTNFILTFDSFNRRQFNSKTGTDTWPSWKAFYSRLEILSLSNRYHSLIFIH